MPVSDWSPGLPDVGAVIRARTKDNVGNELGTFTPDTRPTDEQTAVLISQATSDVAMVTSGDIPSQCWTDATSVTALACALRIELSYFPEQINTGRSPYPQLKQLFDDQLKRLLISIEAAGGEAPGVGGGAPIRPQYAFNVPDPNIWFDRWLTPGTYPILPGNQPGVILQPGDL